MKSPGLSFIRAFIIFYLAMMILSYLIQFSFTAEEQPNKYQKERYLDVDDHEIELNYLHVSGRDVNRALIILPDYLDNPEILLQLAESLADGFDVYIPVYPTSDRDGNSVPHTLEFRASVVDTFSDELAMSDVNLLGYGYGGLVAFNLLGSPATDFEKYHSLTLLSSFGPVELHFLGNHTINLSLYTLLYPAVTFVKYFTPHMGWFVHQPIQYSYISTLRALDHREVRNDIRNIGQPVLILHPGKDNYVSLSVAEENHRLLPQSYLVTHDGGHNLIQERPDLWSNQIKWFADLVERGDAQNRAVADRIRTEMSQAPFDASGMDSIGGWTLFIIILLLAVSTIISEDLACIAGGLIVASGVIDFWFAVLGCFSGILIADVSIYLMGRWIGSPVLRWVPFRWFIKREDVERAKRLFRMRGAEIIFITRFLPGTRLPTYLVAGMLKTKFPYFLGYFLLAITIWTPMLVGLSALIGQPMLHYLQVYQDYAMWILPVIILVIYLVIKFIMPLTTVSGRRRLLVKWERFKERNFQ